MTENDEINKKINLMKQKNSEVYKQWLIDEWLSRKFEFNYVNTENEKLSLPCPVDGCICETFSRIFDKYLPETRSRILSLSKAINENNNEILWQ